MNKLLSYKILPILLLILIFKGYRVNAQYSEYEIKAAYIFNFAKFIEWPENNALPTDTIVLGIYKNDPFGIILEKTMIGRKANGKSWKIVRINKISEIDQCHILFCSGIGKYELGIINKYISQKHILTIGDEIPDFCELGGVINFTPQFSSHQFEINNRIANKNGIVINPKLLKLAKIVSISEDEF